MKRNRKAAHVTTVARVGLAALAFTLVLGPSAAVSSDGDIPRRPDGKPDLSGIYDTATLTPLVRPNHYGDRLSLTDEEAAALAAHWRGNFEKDYEPSDPNREAPPKGGVGIYAPEFTGAAGKVGGYNAGFVDIGENAFKLDGHWRTSIMTYPENGQYPALSDLGKKLQSETAMYRHENTGTAWWMHLEYGPYDDPEARPLAERCLLARRASGPPTTPGMYNNLKRIVQTDDYVMINIEWMHDTRIIRLAGDHEPEELLRWSGDSVGRWDGDTLVVETKNLRTDGGIARPFAGRHVIERFKRIDADTLHYSFVVNDPMFAERWEGEYPWPATPHRMYEYACHEGNYALDGILRGARLLESEAAANEPGPSGSD